MFVRSHLSLSSQAAPHIVHYWLYISPSRRVHTRTACRSRLHILQIEFHIPVVPIPHFRDNRNLLVVIVNLGD